MDKRTRDEATARVREFYDGPADTIYKTTWGENLHLGRSRRDPRTVHARAPEPVIIREETVTLETGTGAMGTYLFRPAVDGYYPGIAVFSEIYQVTGPIQRVARLIAGQGYIVAAPEVYHEFEPPFTPLAYNESDTAKGNRYKIEKEVEAYDGDARAILTYLGNRPDCNGRLGSFGICLGGHLSFRAAMNPDVQAGACFYATDIHSRTLGQGKNDNSLDRLGEIPGELLMVWGKQDNHIPQEGRDLFLSSACIACHRVEGTSAQGVVGPDLTHVGSRGTIAAGVLENTPEEMARWLRAPEAVKPGVLMPNQNLTEDQIEKLVAYLASLQ